MYPRYATLMMRTLDMPMATTIASRAFLRPGAALKPCSGLRTATPGQTWYLYGLFPARAGGENVVRCSLYMCLCA